VRKVRPFIESDLAGSFQDQMVALVRSLGLHRPDQTPCGQPISVAEAHALLEIGREAGITQNGLAARLRLEKSTVSRVAAVLERRGWIRRERDPSDARYVQLSLTARGVKANARIAQSRREHFERIFAAIPDSARGSVIESLAVLAEVAREN
jgi:DNA-binding MarR family transcriptional regulator